MPLKFAPENQLPDQGRQPVQMKFPAISAGVLRSVSPCCLLFSGRLVTLALAGSALLLQSAPVRAEVEPVLQADSPIPEEVPEVPGTVEAPIEQGEPVPVPARASLPDFRGSVVPGDTALMRVTDRASGAIARSSYGPAFRAGAPGIREGSGRTGLHFGPVTVEASVTAGVFLEKESPSRGGQKPGWQPAFRISPSLTGTVGHPEIGRYVTFEYAASLESGGNSSKSGGIDQDLSFDAFYDFAKLKLKFGANYSKFTGPDRDIGGTTDRTLFGINAGASYPLSVKSSLRFELADSHSSYSGGLGTEQVQGSLFFDRQVSVKTRLELGTTLGTAEADAGEKQTFEQLHLRASYFLTPKIALSAMAGLDVRQGSGRNDATPIMAADVTYRFRHGASLQLAAERAVNVSATQQNSSFVNNTFTLALSQSFGQRVNGSLAVGYEYATYGQSEEGDSGSGHREDHYFFLRPTVTWSLSERLNLTLFYSLGSNKSSTRSFDTQQLGFSGTAHF